MKENLVYIFMFILVIYIFFFFIGFQNTKYDLQMPVTAF